MLIKWVLARGPLLVVLAAFTLFAVVFAPRFGGRVMPSVDGLEVIGQRGPYQCSETQFAVLLGILDKDGQPGWNAVYVGRRGEDGAFVIDEKPLFLADFDPDRTFLVAYIDRDLDGRWDERWTDLEAFYAKYGQTACEITLAIEVGK